MVLNNIMGRTNATLIIHKRFTKVKVCVSSKLQNHSTKRVQYKVMATMNVGRFSLLCSGSNKEYMRVVWYIGWIHTELSQNTAKKSMTWLKQRPGLEPGRGPHSHPELVMTVKE